MRPSEYEVMFCVEDRHWWYRALRAEIQDDLDRFGPAGGRLLDAGCGAGANLTMFAARYGGIGIDAAPEAIAFCRQRGVTAAATATLTDLPFPDRCFDVVLSCDVLCHRSIRDKFCGAAELARVLQPGGVLVVNLPAYQWLYSSHDEAVFTDRRFTRAEVRLLMEAAGLEVLSIRHWNSLLFPVMLAVRMWRKWVSPGVSDLAAGSGVGLTSVLDRCMTIERKIGRLIAYPVGLSVLAVGRKPR